MSDDATFDLVVAGGGAAGLARAFWTLAQRPDARVLVVEAKPRLGGWIETRAIDGYQVELGPQGFRPDDSIDGFLDRTGLASGVVPCSDSSKRRWLARSGRLHQMPGGPGSLIGTRLLSLGAKLRLFWEPRVKSRGADDESVAAFLLRRFGKETVPFAEAMMSGIYAGDAHTLEVGTVLPMLAELEREAGSVMRGMGRRAKARRKAGMPRVHRPTVCTFPGGMQQSVDVLAAALGERVVTSTPVQSVAARGRAGDGGFEVALGGAAVRVVQTRALCLATPPAATATLLRSVDDELAQLLAGIDSVSVASTYLGYDLAAAPPDADGFGFLAPQKELGPVLGAIFSSRVFPQQAPAGKLLFRVMSGGFAAPGEVERSDDDLRQQGADLLQRYVGMKQAPEFAFTSRAVQAIPQYTRGHGRRVAAIAAAAARHRGLSLCGAAYRKVSVVGQWSEEGSRP